MGKGRVGEDKQYTGKFRAKSIYSIAYIDYCTSVHEPGFDHTPSYICIFLLGSANQKINFYKSIPLPMWDVHCSIPLLDPP